MTSPTLRNVARAAMVLATLGIVTAHVRLRHPTTQVGLFWATPTNVSIVVNRTGSDDIPDGSHVTAVRNAIDEWNRATDTTLQLVENTSEAAVSRTDWEADDIHLVLWDEDNSSGFFGGNGAVAITPIFFFSNGVIADADVLFNGEDFTFTTTNEPGSFDVQTVATHELGHLVGFDHSGWAGATMFPFVETTVELQRSIALDERVGLRDAYPAGAVASITGTVRRIADGSVIAGAHVVARDSAGRTAGSTLSETNGGFTLRGLVPDTYTVYATPFEGVVDEDNLGDGFVIQTGFESTVHPLPVMVTPGVATALGDLGVGDDVPVVLGNNLTAFPLLATIAQSTSMAIRGTGLVSGSVLTASDPNVMLSGISFTGSQVSFTCFIPGNAEPGHFDLQVTTPTGGTSILPAPIEIVPAAPTVSNAAPGSGTNVGGIDLTITGTGFRPGARVVIGDTIYVDGEPGGAQVQGSTIITLTTAAMVAGNHDVVVIEETGVEGRLASGFQALGIPTLDTVYPPAGSTSGGTRVVMTGADFANDVIVRINGVAQPNVDWIDETLIEVTTEPAAAGGPFDVEVVNPGPATASLSGAFGFVGLPDPRISSFTPDIGSPGTLVTITGTGFNADTRIVFGADPETGQGGVMGDAHDLVNANTLEVLAPPAGGGVRALVATNSMTGQASFAASSFTLLGGDSGGGCTMADGGAPPFDPKRVLVGGGWFLALLVLFAWRARRTVTA